MVRTAVGSFEGLKHVHTQNFFGLCRVRTAVGSFEGLKPYLHQNKEVQDFVRTAVGSFEGLKPLFIERGLRFGRSQNGRWFL